MKSERPAAPELQVSRWFNARGSVSLAGLRGKIVVLHAFQMLCPGCVAHSIPQAKKLHEFARGSDEVQVIGIHTVFEHHEAMTPVSLEAFLHEYRIAFPVAVDQPGDNHPLPKTMAAYGMRGTPTTIVIDRAGRIARHSFGAEDDLAFGLFLGGLAGERDAGRAQSAIEAGICKIDEGCV